MAGNYSGLFSLIIWGNCIQMLGHRFPPQLMPLSRGEPAGINSLPREDWTRTLKETQAIPASTIENRTIMWLHVISKVLSAGQRTRSSTP